MNLITKLETIVMNMTGCSRGTANLVVNVILDELEEVENNESKKEEKEE